MKLSTSLIITAVGAAIGVSGSLLFIYLADTARHETAEARLRLAQLEGEMASSDSLSRLDSLAANFKSPDLSFHELKGRVRSMRYGEEHVEFDRDGRWTNPQAYVSRSGNSLRFERNKFDYIISGVTAEQAEGAPLEQVEYTWRGDRVTRIAGTGFDGSKYRIDMTYDGKLRMTQLHIVSSDEGGESEIVSTFTYNKFDDHGNWTSRTARSSIKTVQYGGFYDDENDTFVEGGEPVLDSSEETEERIITYYHS